MPIPTANEINVYDSLDEPTAREHFLGKTLDQAEALFCENSLYYQEDLLWMGPVAFRYYVAAAIRYLQSEVARGDCDMVGCFTGLLEFRLRHEPGEMLPVAGQLGAACEYSILNYDKFDIDLNIYGDVRARLAVLRDAFAHLLAAPDK